MASRTSILETIPRVVSSPPTLKAKSTVGTIELFFFDLGAAISHHKIRSLIILIGIVFFGLAALKRRIRRNRGGFFRLDEKDSLLGSGSNGKVD